MNDIYNIYEALMDIQNQGVQNGYLILSINGRSYRYKSDQYSAQELEEKFNAIAKHSVGRALAWVEKNSKSEGSSRPSSKLSLESRGIEGDQFVVSINGKVYHYQSNNYSAKELEEKFNAITKHKGAAGRALTWLKNNAITSDSYSVKKGGTQAVKVANKAPYPEVKIRDSSNGGGDVRKFVTSHVKAITDAYDFTTVFIDTDIEYKKYGVSVPSVALICTDLRKTVASLKRDPLVIKFNKSKTLKRVSEWQRGKFVGFDKPVWYSMYSSAKAIRLNESEDSDLTYLGYLNDNGTVSVAPCVGESIEINGKLLPIVEASDCYVVKNGYYSFRLDESEVSQEVILEESTLNGKIVGDYTVVGIYEDCLVLSDANDLCYLYEASLDVKSKGIQEGALAVSVNGKDLKYVSDQYSAKELENKFNTINDFSSGRAISWLNNNAMVHSFY